MQDYIECNRCGFVLRAAATTDPQPLHWELCPGCDGDDFFHVE